MNRPEQAIHKAVIKHLKSRAAPGVVYWHTANNIPMGGKHAARLGGLMKAMGVRAGVSDIVALHNGEFFALELKAPGGRPTESQLEFLAAVNRAGGYGVVAESFDAAILCLEHWGLLKGTAQ